MFFKKNIFFFLFLTLIGCNDFKAQDSTRKFSYFKNDSVLRNKMNLTFECGFQIPKHREFKYTSLNIPANEGFDDYLLYNTGNISYRKRRTFDASLNANFKLVQKFYLGLGIKWRRINEIVEVHSDSLFYKNQFELYSVTANNRGNLIQIPFYLQYRINKYFYPFIGYAVNGLTLGDRTLRDSWGREQSSNINRSFLKLQNEKIAGFDFNIPSANRLYFTFKFVHTGNKWTIKDKDLWYSFGLKYYII
jgi:hypothetical protein